MPIRPSRVTTLPLAIAASMLSSAAALAHHGWSSYLDESFSLTGTVEEASFGNPHGELSVLSEGEAWAVVLGPPFRNERADVTAETVRVGDEVTAHGNRHRDPEVLEMKTQTLEVNGETYEIY